ncbi:hypothetical protein [Halorubrum laminariae]|uniref:M23 family metallopeptidase n=1 Tax=Halorubrum laminariae TaxID=1433523 RepID=A0ABD6BY17_9EURY|nr:hypothetical protein [Halorubrum laminariae]
MPISIAPDILSRYRRFSRFNSPYRAHDDGSAIDCYPAGEAGPSPVSGVVRETRTVTCPDRAYAADEDHLIVIDLDDTWCERANAPPGTVARILHVIPEVTAGDRVAVGDRLGVLTRSGFFGQWVDDHVHLGFRSSDADPIRASGSLPVTAAVDVEAIEWGGSGTVVERGPTHVVLDAPAHPAPGERFAALASDEGVPIDGGLTHYGDGGTFGAQPLGDGTALSLWGSRVGVARGRGVEWDDVAVVANGERVAGLSLFAARDGLGAKVVWRDPTVDVGDDVRVEIARDGDRIRLGDR